MLNYPILMALTANCKQIELTTYLQRLFFHLLEYRIYFFGVSKGMKSL